MFWIDFFIENGYGVYVFKFKFGYSIWIVLIYFRRIVKNEDCFRNICDLWF